MHDGRRKCNLSSDSVFHQERIKADMIYNESLRNNNNNKKGKTFSLIFF